MSLPRMTSIDILPPKPDACGAICWAGGRQLEITSPHAEWLQWALDTLYAQAKQDNKAAKEIER